jgi:hypothetical protein
MHSKKLVYCVADTGDNGGLFNFTFTWLRASADALGVETIKLNLGKTEDFLRLPVYVGDKNYTILSNIWLYDLQLRGFGLASPEVGSINAELPRFNITAVIADHPFTTYMYQRISRATPTFKYLFLDESYNDVVAHIRGSPLPGEKLLGVPTPSYGHDELPPYQDRLIDMLAPMAINYPKISKIWECISDQNLKSLFSYVWNTYSYAHEKTAYQYWIECSKSIIGSEVNLCAGNETFRNVLIQFLSDIDLLSRARFREDTIGSIARTFPDKKIYVTDSPSPTLSAYRNVHFIGRVGFDQCVQLIANSKRVLHCHPTYFNSFHERPIISQALGSLVVTPSGRWTENLLPKSFVSFEPGEDFEMLHRTMDSVSWPGELDRIDPETVSNTYGTKKFLMQLLM